MTRLEALKQFIADFHGKKLSRQITESEFDEMMEFLDDWDHLSPWDFEKKINRWYMDNPNKPKHLFIMGEILSSANAKLVVKK